MKKEKILDLVQQLADTGTIKEVCHHQLKDSPLPSVPVLSEIVQLCRSVLFPGYFGDAGVNSRTVMYHIGVNIDRLQLLLNRQIKAGLCFEAVSEEEKNPGSPIKIIRVINCRVKPEGIKSRP